MSKIKHVKQGEICLLTVDLERLVDDLTLQGVHREIVEVLDEFQDKRVVLDLTRVTFVASAALGMFVRIRKRCGETGVALKICIVSPAIDETFRITGLNTLFEIYPSAELAIASFSGN